MSECGNILVVDDNPSNVFVLEEMLGETYSLATAASGEEALTMAPAFQPDLVLLDIMMPGIDGYETCRRLRTMSTLHHTRIVMVSAKTMIPERIQGYEAGADDYITKPFNKDELQAKVRAYLRLISSEEAEQKVPEVLAPPKTEVEAPEPTALGKPMRAIAMSSPPRASIQLMIEMKERLRRHGMSVALTAPDTYAQLLTLSADIEELQELRQKIIEIEPPSICVYLFSQADAQLTCARCQSLLTLKVPDTASLAHPIRTQCSCGMPFAAGLESQD